MTATKGHLFVVAAPSGGGKTSIVKAVIERNRNIQVAVSHTTRNIRPGEEDGVNYHFTPVDEFHKIKAADGFLESAEVFGNYYGTSIEAVEGLINQGVHLILEIDWQGAQQIHKRIPKSKSIFILPPSHDELHRRLQGRGQDDEATIAGRMSEAESEMSHYNEFDYLIINDQFEQAVVDMTNIILTEDPALLLKTQLDDSESNLDNLLKDLLQDH